LTGGDIAADRQKTEEEEDVNECRPEHGDLERHHSAAVQ
jgi:hypothetical protein